MRTVHSPRKANRILQLPRTALIFLSVHGLSSLVSVALARATESFPGSPLPEECFEKTSAANTMIFEDVAESRPLDAQASDVQTIEARQNVPPEDLPPEGEQYTRVITQTRRAWDFSEGSADVVVAIVDSGIDLKHPDLASNISVNFKEKNGKPGVDDDGNGFVDDVHGWDFVLDKPISIDRTGHGTHCAGNVAALRNGVGVVGVAPRVKVLPVRFMNNGSGETVNAIKAVLYAAQRGAQVISNSWGSSSYNPCLEMAFKYAQNRGAWIVSSAGNGDKDLDRKNRYPASYPGVIAVGSSNAADLRTSSSNWGKKGVFIFAPGEDSLSTDKNGGYSLKTGTSMAAPQVAGAIALGLSYRPRLAKARIQELLCQSASTALRDVSRCGRMDVGQFLEALSRE